MNDLPRIPRILLTNDDGIDAPGLAVLEKAAAAIADEVWVVAPETEQSGASQAITLNDPLLFTKRDTRHFAVRGKPSDCVILALFHLMKDTPPSLLLSGVNRGTNHGDASLHSGTVGAALTGLMYNVPSIAFSQCYEKRTDMPWATAEAIVPKCLTYFVREGWKKDTCLSVNIPALASDQITGLCWAHQSQKSIIGYDIEAGTSPRGQDYAWLKMSFGAPDASSDSEAAVLERGKVSVTALTLDRSLEVLKPQHRFADDEGDKKAK